MEGVLVISNKIATSLRLPDSLDEGSGILSTHYVKFGQELLGAGMTDEKATEYVFLAFAGCDYHYSYVFLRDSGLMSIRLLPK
jgi:hypothetical protein